MLGGGVARGLAQALEAEGDGAQVGVFVRGHVLLQPASKFHVIFGSGSQYVGNLGVGAFFVAAQRGRLEAGQQAVQLGLWHGVRATVFFQDVAVFLLHLVKVALALGLHQNFDAGLVHVVAAAPAVVDAHNGLQVIHDLVPG